MGRKGSHPSQQLFPMAGGAVMGRKGRADAEMFHGDGVTFVRNTFSLLSKLAEKYLSWPGTHSNSPASAFQV